MPLGGILAAAALLAGAAPLPAQTPAPAEAAAPAHRDGYTDTPVLPDGPWHVHDPARPLPPVVAPGGAGTGQPAAPPADAVVLFDGRDLAQWRSAQGEPARWTVADGAMTAGGGDIVTAREFGDFQLHVEFATPTPPRGHGQERGNSGVLLQGRYEVQVLDSYENTTYADGQAAALYGQQPPLVNASRPPGQWQTYDIVFNAPRFDAGGLLQAPAFATVFHNGVLVQNHAALLGPTLHRALARYNREPATGPIRLQDHGNPVRYRNVWIRPLPGEGQGGK